MKNPSYDEFAEEMYSTANSKSTQRKIRSANQEIENDKSVLGLLYSAASVFCLSFLPPILKTLYNHNPHMTGSEALYWKSLQMIVCNAIYNLYSLGTFDIDVPKGLRGVMLLRALSGFFHNMGNFSQVFYLPIGLG